MHKSEYKRIEELENKHFWYRAMGEQVIESIASFVRKKKVILDAGCGTGGMSLKLTRFGTVYAVDINETALKFAQKKGLRHVIKASVSELPFQDDYFDLVVCLDVLYHKKVTDDTAALKELYRVLKPKGLLLLRLPALEILRGAHDIVVETRHRYTTGEVGRKMKTSGFTVVGISYANMLLTVPLLIKRSLERIKGKRYFHSDSHPLPLLINEIFYLILNCENQLLKYISLPFGSSVVALGKKIPS
ncbi:MAG: methyltransferase type 11 [Candidatus Gottesmanbacteria bacterium GW2011_GWA2_43_14]|uniref:Methyltransferase type 11 n=1 Tax=Candidatus Gottesmanbacteria bacterium GW2011_GWA2_43_14 TaxID=1618443 RepID=A0A0G1DLF3_9BACT|nr:MAG: methyltransferase type 11 [Candidatus Gottesmanbacteria bacterium GW2011_GWA2_43_14]